MFLKRGIDKSIKFPFKSILLKKIQIPACKVPYLQEEISTTPTRCLPAIQE